MDMNDIEENLDQNNLWIINSKYKNLNYTQFINNSYLNKRIEDIDFSIRTLNCLRYENIIYIYDLIQYSEVELLRLNNFGKKSLNEVKFELEENSIELGNKEFLQILNDISASQINEKYLIDYDKKIKYFDGKDVKESESNQNIEKFSKLSSHQEIAMVQEIEEVDFSIRIINLCKINSLSRVGDLLQIEEKQLLRIPNSGKKSIAEIKEYFAKYNLKLGTKIYNWNDIDLILKIKEAGIMSFDNQEDHNFEDGFFEEEIERVILECANTERNKDIYLSFYGINNSSRQTLEKTAVIYDLTRERVRQIIKKINLKIKRKKPNMRLLKKIINLINNETYLNEKMLNAKINTFKLSKKSDWNIKSIVDFSKIFNILINSEFSITQKLFYHGTIDLNLLHLFYKRINKLIVSEGCASLELLKAETEYESLFLREDMLIEELINIELSNLSGFIWLDEYNDWFTYFTNRNRLNNMIYKLLAVSPKIIQNDLVIAINRNYRKSLNIPSHIILNYCNKVLDSKIEDGLLIFNNLKNTSYKLSTLEKIIIQMFKDYGPVLFYRDILEFSKLSNINENSVNKMIGELIYIKRLERETYILQSDFWNLQSNNLVCQVSITNESGYEIFLCPPVKNISVTIEIFENGIMKEFLPYPRHLRFIKKLGKYGVIYHNQVYPIISKYYEDENGLREKLELKFDEI